MHVIPGLDTGPDVSDVEAVAVYARPQRGVFQSRPDEPNANTHVVANKSDAVVHVLDMGILGTLLFQNTRIGRPIDHRVGGFDVLAQSPPPPGATTFADVMGQVVSDDFGPMYLNEQSLGFVPLFDDGSAKFSYPGGLPIRLRLTDADDHVLDFPAGAPFMGPMVQREAMEFRPGERSNQSFPRRFFNGLCAGCHGFISGRELDQAINVDVLTSASRTEAYGADPVGLSP